MVIVKKGNAEYRVPDEKLDEYLAMGYSQIDESGKVIREPGKRGEAALREKVSALETELTRLVEVNAALREQIAALEAGSAEMGKENAALQERMAELQKEIALKPDETENPQQKAAKSGKKESP